MHCTAEWVLKRGIHFRLLLVTVPSLQIHVESPGLLQKANGRDTSLGYFRNVKDFRDLDLFSCWGSANRINLICWNKGMKHNPPPRPCARVASQSTFAVDRQ